jgi:hypothetical protein
VICKVWKFKFEKRVRKIYSKKVKETNPRQSPFFLFTFSLSWQRDFNPRAIELFEIVIMEFLVEKNFLIDLVY